MNTEVFGRSMNSIGERLQQERLRQGLDLNQIAELTKISSLMLEAIEADDFDRLPGSFFARSFVRQYARALGLDEEEFESELRRVAGFGHPAADQPQAPVPEIVARPQPVPPARSRPNRNWLGSLVGFLLILVVCSAVYKWQRTRGAAAKSQQVSLATPAPSPTPPPAETPTATPEAAAPTATPLETPAAEPVAPPSPEPGTPTPEPTPPSAPPPAAQTAAIRLELRATSEAWVRVVSDGKTLYSGVLQPNEARVFEGTSSITLRTGNAAALAATYNGKPLGELGPEGQVRTIQFTPSGFQVVPPAPAAPADQPY
jgi:cytoskeleton protein RodZ